METAPLTETRIVEGATELFCRYGLKSVTMDDISRHLGMSKKTIYQHFQDKEQIIHAFANNELQKNNHCLRECEDTAKDPVQEMVVMMQFMETSFRRFNPNLFYDMQKHYPEVWSLFREFKSKWAMDHIVSNIERGKEKGLYRKNINPRIMAILRLEQVELAMNPSVYPPDKFSIPDIQVQLLEHFLHGICTLRGHRLVNKYLQIQEEED